MSLAKIQNALAREFERKRIVFWYDPELIGWQQEFDALELAGVVKVSVQNNEFGVKHRIVRGDLLQRGRAGAECSLFSAKCEIEWMQNGRLRMGSSSCGFSLMDSLKNLLPSSPLILLPYPSGASLIA